MHLTIGYIVQAGEGSLQQTDQAAGNLQKMRDNCPA